jgi:RNA exonuclease 1
VAWRVDSIADLQYTPVSALDPSLASRSATAEELDISASSPDLASYKRAIHHTAVSISRRPPPDSLDHPSVGTARVSRTATTKADKEAAGRLTRKRCERYILPRSAYETWRYPDPADISLLHGDQKPDAAGTSQKCDRCQADFLVTTSAFSERKGECVYHYGKLLPDKIEGKRTWAYTCCRKDRASAGCHKGVHVFNEREDDEKLASRVSFRTVRAETEENRRLGRAEAFADVVGMDCEMICEDELGGSLTDRYHCRILARARDDC